MMVFYNNIGWVLGVKAAGESTCGLAGKCSQLGLQSSDSAEAASGLLVSSSGAAVAVL
jgi:hypothetical protein